MRSKIELPLTIFSRHLSKDIGQLHDAINNSIVDIDVSIDPVNNNKLESYLADLKQHDFQTSFIRYGLNTSVQCLQDDYYCIVVPYTGHHTIQHKVFNFTQQDKVSFIPPLTDIKMKYSADCGHLVLRFKSSSFNDEIFAEFYRPEFIKDVAIQEAIYQIAMNFIQGNCFVSSHTETKRVIHNLKQSIYDVILNYSRNTHFKPDFITGDTKKLVDFINANINWEYNIEDLSSLSKTPVRTLYWRFKKYTGISPYRYHLNCKLKCARLDILKFADSITVTEIAVKYGFIHLSRFSSQYKSLFGELPKETMEHCRSQ